MPLLQNEKRKQDFMNDIQAMISGNVVLSKSVKGAEDFEQMIQSAGDYFAKGKDQTSAKLVGYIQNFKGLYDNFRNAMNNGDLDNQYANEILKEINTMRNGFKETYNSYIKANKYTALKNDNVKNLSALVQIAEDMGQRLGMEERAETIDYAHQQLQFDVRRSEVIRDEYKDYIESCSKQGIDFVNTNSELQKNLNIVTEKEQQIAALEKKEKELTNDSNKKELEEVESYRQQIVDFNNKRNAAKNKKAAIFQLKEDFQYARKDSDIVKEQIKQYKDEIATHNANILDLELSIEAYTNIIARGEKYSQDIKNYYAHPAAIEYNKTFDKYEALYRAHDDLSSMATSGLNPSELLSKTDLNPEEKTSLEAYNKLKKDVCDSMPEMSEKFDELEKDPEQTMEDFYNEFSNDIVNKINDYDDAILDFQATNLYKNFQHAKEQLKEAEASKNTLASLEKQLAENKEGITEKEALIGSLKLEGGWGKRIKDTLGYLPVEPITEKKLREAMHHEYEKAKQEYELLKESKEGNKLAEKMTEAQKRADEKDIGKITQLKNKLLGEKIQAQNKVDALQKADQKHSELRAKNDRIIDDRKSIIDHNAQFKNISPNKEIFDRLVSIRTRFDEKTNHKMNPECAAMIGKLEDAILAFNPDNPSEPEQQAEALRNVKDFAGRYLDAKNNQRIPKWLASEQRMLRISCAEEMQGFSDTAQKMLDDYTKLPNMGSAELYVSSRCDLAQKKNFEEYNMGAAARKAGKFPEFQKYKSVERAQEKKVNTNVIENEGMEAIQ